MDNERNFVQEENDSDFNLGLLLRHFLLNWKLFAVSLAVCLVVAVFYVYNSTRIYSVSAKILLQDSEKGSFASQFDMLADFGYKNTGSSVENEIEVINSVSVVKAAVQEAGLYISYYRPKLFGFSPIYKMSSPVNAAIQEEDLAQLRSSLQITLEVEEDSTYNVSYAYKNIAEGLEVETEPQTINEFPYLLATEKGNILLTFNEGAGSLSDVKIVISPLYSAALAYKGSLAIAPVSKTASVAIVATNTAVSANGIDFIDAVIKGYNDVTNEDKRQVAKDTERFILERIDSISNELGERERRLANYKKNNQMLTPELDAPQTLRSKVEYVKKMEEMEILMKNCKYLSDFINDSKNNLQAIPSTLGVINEPAMASLINHYNSEVAERNLLLLTATAENPALKVQTELVRTLQSDIRGAVKAYDESLQVQYSLLEKLTREYTDRLEMSPDLERSLAEITRERDIKSQLYVMLLQKYEENALTLAVTANNLRCIDPAMCSSAPVAPRTKMIYLVALMLGVILPALYVYIKEMLRTKISSPEEVEKLTTMPVVASIPAKHGMSGRSSSLVVRENKNDIMAEAFRTLRTNLNFIIKKQTGNIVMFTSTVSGEGKTFVSSNFAMSVALLGKKVLMMGVDIRRPRLAEVFNINPKAEGITSYLSGDEKDVALLDSLILQSTESPNLHLLPAGIVPPNPAELLAKTNIETALDYLSKKYDYIIMDSAPVGLVSDSFILSRVADVVVYVARIDYTEKNSFDFVNTAVKDGKLKNVSIAINGDDVEKRRGLANNYLKSYYYGYTYITDGTKVKERKERRERKKN